jgi:four helix bundle protein
LADASVGCASADFKRQTKKIMAKIERFEDLKCWHLAREIARDLFDLSNQGTFARDFDLRSQIRRSSGSTMDNVAEGFERNGRAEFVQFRSIAKGSAGEVRSQLYRAFDNRHIDESALLYHKERAEQLSKMLSGFIAYLAETNIKGVKYKVSEPELDYRTYPPANSQH